ncbi:MAG: OmpH family outer membrane protein [Oxalobacter sp.]|nr:OmpH family outer membrane protein [Oxalobacter sp.]
MNDKSLGFTLAAAAVALSAAGYLAYRKYRNWRRPAIAILDVDAVVSKSLPGRAAAQYLRTAKNILQRNIDEVKKLHEDNAESPEAMKAINQAESFAQQQSVIYQRKLDEEIQKIIRHAVKVWLGRHKRVKAVIPADNSLGYSPRADITNEIIAEMRRYQTSFPPMPRPRGA